MKKNEFILYLLVFTTINLYVVLSHLFLALSFAGGFIDVLLYGIIPALVVLIGRYVNKMTGPYQVMGSLTPMHIDFQ